MRYEFKPQALKQLQKFPKNVQVRIIKKLDYYTSLENPIARASHLTDSRIGQYRFRIGNYRVIFDVKGNSLSILAVGDRKEIYK